MVWGMGLWGTLDLQINLLPLVVSEQQGLCGLAQNRETRQDCRTAGCGGGGWCWHEPHVWNAINCILCMLPPCRVGVQRSLACGHLRVLGNR